MTASPDSAGPVSASPVSASPVFASTVFASTVSDGAVPRQPSGPPLTLLVIAKEPVPGRVKTRLVPPCSYEQAAALAEAALADTLRAVAAVPARRRVLVLDGRPGPWLPAGFDVLPQCDGPLDERLAAAFAAAGGPALLIGMDTPQVTPALLATDWHGADAVFGPADDGGFWALGLRDPDPALLRGVPMSTADTGAVQRARLIAAGLLVTDLPRLRDVDTAADAVAVARLAPDGRFAARARQLGPVLTQDPVPSQDPGLFQHRRVSQDRGVSQDPGLSQSPGLSRDAVLSQASVPAGLPGATA